jgi:membrane protein
MMGEAPVKQKNASASISAFLKELYRIWITERPTQFAAALAYYAIFSFVPVIYIAFSITDIFVSRLSVSEQFYAQITGLLGVEIAQALQDAVAGLAERTGSTSPLVSLISFVVLVFTASLLFFQLQHTLNTLWKVPPPTRGETRAYVRNRLLAFAGVLGVVVLMIVATAVNLLVSLVSSFLDWGSPVSFGSLIAFVGLAALSFALLYKVLPNATVAWRDVWVGAGVAAVLVTVGFYLLKLYLGANKFSSALEAAGAVAVFLMGFYYLGQIFVLGALFTRVYASMLGSGIVPREEESPSSEAASGESLQDKHDI